ncbi:hypothetical protein Vafri_11008, partial [Volvox africanus]
DDKAVTVSPCQMQPSPLVGSFMSRMSVGWTPSSSSRSEDGGGGSNPQVQMTINRPLLFSNSRATNGSDSSIKVAAAAGAEVEITSLDENPLAALGTTYTVTSSNSDAAFTPRASTTSSGDSSSRAEALDDEDSPIMKGILRRLGNSFLGNNATSICYQNQPQLDKGDDSDMALHVTTDDETFQNSEFSEVTWGGNLAAVKSLEAVITSNRGSASDG